MNIVKELFEYREMIFRMVQRDLRGKYKGSVLGYFWTLLSPLLQLLVYTIVFSIIMRAGYDRYYFFLFVALVPWIFFSGSITSGATLVINQKDLVNKIYFPREILPISHVVAQMVNMMLSLLIVFGVQITIGQVMSIKCFLWLPVIILLEFLMTLGFTFFFSAITVYFRDIQFLISVVMLAWQFLSPIMYGLDMVPDRFVKFFYINPMTCILLSYRDILYYRVIPSPIQILLATGYAIVILIIGICVFEKLKKHFSEEL